MITLIAVPFGALVSALFLAIGPGTLSPGEVLVAVPALAVVGLILLGLPLAGLTFGITSVWLGVLRLITYGMRGGLRSYAAASSDQTLPMDVPTARSEEP